MSGRSLPARRNLPIRGHADSVVLTAAPPRRTESPIIVPEAVGVPTSTLVVLALVGLVALGLGLLVVGRAFGLVGGIR